MEIGNTAKPPVGSRLPGNGVVKRKSFASLAGILVHRIRRDTVTIPIYCARLRDRRRDQSMRLNFSFIPLLSFLLLVSGCGGSISAVTPSAGPPSIPPTVTTPPLPPATTSSGLPVTFLGLNQATFHGIDGDSGSHGVWLYRDANGESKISIVDDDTIQYLKTEDPPVQNILLDYNASSGLWEWASYEPYKYELTVFGDYIMMSIVGSDTQMVQGGFGFETLSMPESSIATYSTNSVARVFVRPGSAGKSDVPVDIDGSGSVVLTANFGTSGSITGTLFDATGLTDYDGDSQFDDRVTIFVSMSGTASGSKITGALTGGSVIWDIDNDGVNVESGMIQASSSEVDAGFYGANTDLVGGTWESAFDGGEAIGYFHVLKD